MKKYKIVGCRLVRAQNAQVSEAILVKVDSILVLGFLQSGLEGSKSLEEYCGVTAYYKEFQHLVGLKDCLFKKMMTLMYEGHMKPRQHGTKYFHWQVNISSTETIWEEKYFKLIQKTD